MKEALIIKKIAAAALAVSLAVLPAYSQTVKKLRVLGAPGINQNPQPKNWHNTLGVSSNKLVLTCPKCIPIQTVTVPKGEISEIRYGQNAYHHWAAGIVTGIFSLGIGAIVGFMPHHQHFYSIDLKDGKAVGIQADKSNYKQIALVLENFTALPIHATAKDAHFLLGYNVVVDSGSTSSSKSSK